MCPSKGTHSVKPSKEQVHVRDDRHHPAPRFRDTHPAGHGAGTVEGLPEPRTGALRLDDEEMPLLGLCSCEVGKRALMTLDVRCDGIATTRQTTLVADIRPAD